MADEKKIELTDEEVAQVSGGGDGMDTASKAPEVGPAADRAMLPILSLEREKPEPPRPIRKRDRDRFW